MNSQRAILSNESNYTVFRVGDKVIRFRAPYSLEHYTEVKEWNHGYIVAMAKYKQNDRPEEEYIDLIPVLKNLYFDPDTFLAPIKEVSVVNGCLQTPSRHNLFSVRLSLSKYPDTHDSRHPQSAQRFFFLLKNTNSLWSRYLTNLC